ncbi:MAG: hypothetical protein J5548_00680 [Prevotella sp.]|nr:hypothetical protein [Prevotella sp.]
MKTSKLLLITFLGLLFSIMTVTIDLQNRGQLITINELPTAAKSCLLKYFPNKEITSNKIKNKIIRTTREVVNTNSYEQQLYGHDMLAYMDY